MKRISIRMAALMLAAALAACGDAPTAPLAEAGPAALNTAPSATVTNSGGNPLISWAALAGAVSYGVVLVEVETETNRQTAESSSYTWQYPVGTTTATSLLDTARGYTGTSMCSYSNYPIVTRITYRYRVTATYANGSAASMVMAPVAQC